MAASFYRFRILLLLVGLLLLVLLALTIVPVTAETALFIAATSPDRHTERIFGSQLPDHPNNDFLIRDGKLYLKIQGTRSALVLTTFLSRYDWTISKFKKLRVEHPEIERYLPDSTKENGGIVWIPNESGNLGL